MTRLRSRLGVFRSSTTSRTTADAADVDVHMMFMSPFPATTASDGSKPDDTSTCIYR
jgi:hypothetical protein